MSKETTFTSFSPEQAAQYAASRGMSYPAPLYQAILAYHTGARDRILDVGTGPGQVVFDLLHFFAHGVGSDASAEMVAQAKRDAVKRGLATKARFVVCSGEDCVEALSQSTGGEKFDLLTVAMAAHWLDMPRFYASAAQALKPGGTLAMWTCSSLFCHPSAPNAEAIQKALDDLESGMLRPYALPGNLLSQDAYEDLPLPWTTAQREAAFEESSFVRTDWDRRGVPSAAPQADGTRGLYLNHEAQGLEDLERSLGSASMVIRWRAANPEQAHTDEDPVTLTMKRIRELAPGDESLVLSPSTSLLMMRRV